MMQKSLIVSLMAMASVPFVAEANLITGVLNVTGTVHISLDDIAFENNSFSITAPADTQQGGFTALEGTSGSIDNLANPPDAAGALDVPLFITFNAATNISITLTYLFPGIDGASGCSDLVPATGQECTPDLPTQSPYNLQNTSPTTSTASFSLLGVEVDSSTGDTIPITGTFSEPFAASTFQQLDAAVEGGDTVTTPFSAEFETISTSPESSTWLELVMGLGAIGISRMVRRFNNKSLRQRLLSLEAVDTRTNEVCVGRSPLR
jgi:hypothetical protein